MADSLLEKYGIIYHSCMGIWTYVSSSLISIAGTYWELVGVTLK